MSDYYKFNQWVHSYYVDNCIPNQINSLSIPTSEIDEFIFDNNIQLASFQEVNTYSWIHLLKEMGGVPQYFGLLALQCLAAYNMQNDSGSSAANFKTPFVKLVGIIDSNELNLFFSEDYNAKLKIQEKIWLSAKEYLSKKNIQISIPPISSFAHRFTRFPKSQVVLNYEDLKEYKSFFTSIKKLFEYIAFDAFKAYYLNKIAEFRDKFLRKNNRKFDYEWSAFELKIKLKQMFDFFCTEEWATIVEKSELIHSIGSKKYVIKFSPTEVLIYDCYYNKIDNLDSLIKNQKFIVFKESRDYPTEFESINSISPQDNNIVIIYNSNANSKEIRDSYKHFLSIKYENNNHNILIFKIINYENLPDFLYNMIISNYPVQLIGFKASAEKKYFVNYPPKITLLDDVNFQIFFNKKRITEAEINKVGKYSIKINGYSNYNFELIGIPVLDCPINDKSSALEFASLEYKEDEIGSINGLLLKYRNTEIIEKLTINNWIKSNNRLQIKTDSKLLKIITNSKNGKY